MSASGLLPRVKLLGQVAGNQLSSLFFSRFLSSSCIKASSYVNFSKNHSRTGDLKPGKTSSVFNGVRHFSLQNWFGKFVRSILFKIHSNSIGLAKFDLK